MSDPAKLISNIPLSDIITPHSPPSPISPTSGEVINAGEIKPVKKKRGRLSKAEGGRNWDPERRHKVVEWKPEYEYIVSLSIQGYTAPAIKAKVEQTLNICYSVNHIYQILRTEQAVKLKQRAIKTIRKKMIDGFVEKEVVIQDKVLERLNQFVSNDTVFEEAPLAAFDRILKLRELHIKQTGKLEEPSKSGVNITVNNNQQVANISVEDGKRIADGIEKLKEIQSLHGLPPLPKPADEVKP